MSHLNQMPSRRPSGAAPSVRASGEWSGAARPSRAPLRRRPESVEIERPANPDFVIDYAVPGCVIAHIRNVTFSAWNTTPTAEHVHAFTTLAKQLSEVYPKSSNVTVVMRDTELPGGEARVALEELTGQFAPYVHSVALVIDGDGFWASMIRSFLTGLHLLRGHGYRCKAFASAAEANPWLVPSHSAETGVNVTPREIDLACEAIYRRMHTEGKPA
jgi:hypothetical protein